MFNKSTFSGIVPTEWKLQSGTKVVDTRLKWVLLRNI